jgi:uncharacterized protein
MSSEITTPCIGVCSTIYGDDICRGCHRSFDEIIEWNSLSTEKKHKILDRLEKLQKKHCSKYILVENEELMLSRLNELNIRVRRNCDPIALAYQLIRQDISNITIDNMHDFGICLNENVDIKTNLNNIITEIDEQIYQESEKSFS